MFSDTEHRTLNFRRSCTSPFQLGMFCDPMMPEKRASYPSQTEGNYSRKSSSVVRKTTEAAGKA